MQEPMTILPNIDSALISYNKVLSKFGAIHPPRPEASKKIKLIGIASHLEQYLNQSSCYSQFQYYFFLSSTPRLVSPEDAMVKTILRHIHSDFFESREEVLFRLALINTSKNQRLSSCIKEINDGRRSSFLATDSQKALSTFLNLYYCGLLNLSNIYNPELFIQIENLSYMLQKKVCELQSEMIFDSYRADYFLKYIDAYLDCFSQANKTFLIGTVIDKDQPILMVKEHLNVLSQALLNTSNLLPLRENQAKCSKLIERIKEIPCQKFSIISEKPSIHIASSAYWKF